MSALSWVESYGSRAVGATGRKCASVPGSRGVSGRSRAAAGRGAESTRRRAVTPSRTTVNHRAATSIDAAGRNSASGTAAAAGPTAHLSVGSRRATNPGMRTTRPDEESDQNLKRKPTTGAVLLS